uniref:Putative lectin subunit alpha-like protein n=1 Tax=Haematobia irritans TaxID=7368 RepID=A0A1L8EBU1_HAEIR
MSGQINITKIFWILPLLGAIYTSVVVASPEWHKSSDGVEYLIESELLYTWLQAHSECARRDLQLVVIDNANKNDAFVALLRKLFDKSPDLWIGHHDNFNKGAKQDRPFFSIANGAQLNYSNWWPGEPNNHNYGENCVQIYSKANFQWNDYRCEMKYGYVCERRPIELARCDLDEIRRSLRDLNNQISEDHKILRQEVKENLLNNRLEIRQILSEWKETTMETLDRSRTSINELIARKPYLQAVVNDVGVPINQIIREAFDEISQNTGVVYESIDGNNANSEAFTMDKTDVYQENLDEHTTTVDKIFEQ